MPPPQMQTYGLRQRPAARSRLASCAEVACEPHVHGWRTTIRPDDPQAVARLLYLRNDCGRHFTEHQLEDGSIAFDFPPEQTCFVDHYVDVATLYVVRDWRGQSAGVPWRKHSGADPWLDECATNQDQLAARQRAQG